ncbi:hypothetical protein [Sphingobium abikonense]|uniref:hypothetical protein n=1 Tax=Sphingobium abikonense TaxID=86193 RepID=UPI003511FC57
MDIPTHREVLAQIEAFLLRHNMAPTRFGREATGEPQLIDSMQKGRSPSLKVLERVAVFMKERDTAAEGASSPSKPNDFTAAQQSEAA